MPDGSRLTIPLDLNLMTPYVLQEQGDWFEAEIHFIRRWLQPGMQVVDVGANYGVYTSAAASAVGPSGQVWAFEPAQLPHACLTQSIKLNHWNHVTLFQIALSDHVGKARLGINSNAELNSLSQSDGAGEEVELSTLNAQGKHFSKGIDYLKLDAEGEEIRILSAASDFFAHHDPLVMFEYKHGSQVNVGLIDAVRAAGMEIYRLVPGIGCLTRLGEGQNVDDFILNLFGCRKSRAAQLIQQGFLADPSHVVGERLLFLDAEKRVSDWMSLRPWSKDVWPDGFPAQHQKGHELYLCGLAELIVAEDSSKPIQERLHRLDLAIQLLTTALEQRNSIGRALSLARAQAHAGLRNDSVKTLRSIEAIFIKRKNSLGYKSDEFFMPADRRHDELSARGMDPGLVIQVMVDEPLLERCAFSTYFLGPNIVSFLRRIMANPLTTSPIRIRVETALQHHCN